MNNYQVSKTKQLIRKVSRVNMVRNAHQKRGRYSRGFYPATSRHREDQGTWLGKLMCSIISSHTFLGVSPYLLETYFWVNMLKEALLNFLAGRSQCHLTHSKPRYMDAIAETMEPHSTHRIIGCMLMHLECLPPTRMCLRWGILLNCF